MEQAVSLNNNHELAIDLSLVGLDPIDGTQDSIAELAKCCQGDYLDLEKIGRILASSDDAIEQRAALQLLEYAEECEKWNFTRCMPVTFKAVTRLLS